ncbi:MAG: DUF2334 domain-containing protein [Lachnospiraceae bacterium]
MSCKIAVRIDDITQDMDWESFEKFKALLDRYGIKPLLGVVPDNKDEHLRRGKTKTDYWEYLQNLQKEGFSLAMHGMHHLYTTKKGGMFPLNHFSEYAGVSYEEQEKMLSVGKQILTEHGIVTDIFMAPGHSYDRHTLQALSKLGFRYVTDGFADRPYEYKQLIFLPIAFHSKKEITRQQGYTTLVYHINDITTQQLVQYEAVFREHQQDFISFGEYCKVKPARGTNGGRIREVLLATMKCMLVRIRQMLRYSNREGNSK